MSDAIPPALTPARWASYRRLCEDIGGSPSTEMLGDHAETEHELAALALHGQPFGFTREDVALLDRAARNAGPLCEYSDEESIAELVARYRDFAARLAALLPP
jgi:hypothetical protein